MIGASLAQTNTCIPLLYVSMEPFISKRFSIFAETHVYVIQYKHSEMVGDAVNCSNYMLIAFLLLLFLQITQSGYLRGLFYFMVAIMSLGNISSYWFQHEKYGPVEIHLL